MYVFIYSFQLLYYQSDDGEVYFRLLMRSLGLLSVVSMFFPFSFCPNLVWHYFIGHNKIIKPLATFNFTRIKEFMRKVAKETIFDRK